MAAELHQASTTMAEAPFNDPDADVVLRSCDRVEFLVSKVILKVVSPVFVDILTLPQPDGTQGSRPIIDMEEDADTLDCLLRFCHPLRKRPRVNSLHKAAVLLRSAMKYEIETVVSLMRGKLVEFVPSKPKRVFAVACKLNLEGVARAAALKLRNRIQNKTCDVCGLRADPHSLSNNFIQIAVDTYSEDFDDVSAGCFYRLIQCIRSTKERLFYYKAPPPLSKAAPSRDLNNIPYASTHPWPAHPMFTHRKPDLILRSSKDEKDIPVHEAALLLSSATSIFELPRDGVVDGIPVIPVPVDGQILQMVVMLCYDCDLEGISLEELRAKNTEALVNVFPPGGGDPLLAFLIASSFNWTLEAEKAARHIYIFCRATVTSTSDPPPVLEFYTVSTYFPLLQFIYQCANMESKSRSLKDPSLFLAFGNHSRKDVERFLEASPTRIAQYKRTYPEQTPAYALHLARRNAFRSTNGACQCKVSGENSCYRDLNVFTNASQLQEETYLKDILKVKIQLLNSSSMMTSELVLQDQT
ncbi:hypothetical protein K474DRAFT_1712160 [Panus rudis PR-1116 ss-1]|nr:hypothetical protein K474DRAFT_1712160 [Panus rudis PR-1116 ss-1]